MNFQEGEILYIDKPYRWTSFDVVNKVRWLLCKRLGTKKLKVGHAGTLDPLATGVMIVCTGRATKRIDELQAHTKEYVATLRLGATTPSFDLEHPIDAYYPTEHITREQVEKVLKHFLGRIEQVPPSYSAVKVDGKRAYDLARKEKEVELKPKVLVIDEIELVDISLTPGPSPVGEGSSAHCASYIVHSWQQIAEMVYAGVRQATVTRTTKETDIAVSVNLDGTGKSSISTGLGFFDHMLEQIAKHGSIDLDIRVKGDLHVDEHHTIEDTALALGEALLKALGDKRGIERYGFSKDGASAAVEYTLPMDDCLCSVALDFGGRPWLVWDAEFHRERVGEMPTEMFLHFFKSLSDAARMNLNIKAEGQNEHHKIEGIFKALARALRMAVRRDIHHMQLPSSKGVL